MHGGVPPTTPPCGPETQAPGSLGAMDATSWGIFGEYFPSEMLGICLIFLNRHMYGLQRVLPACPLPWVLPTAVCPHIHRWCAPYDKTWGLVCHAFVGHVGIYQAFFDNKNARHMPTCPFSHQVSQHCCAS